MAVSALGRIVRANVCQAVFLVVILCSTTRAGSQNLSSGSIDGVVTGESGAALPRVAVSASSPALQVKKRSATAKGGIDFWTCRVARTKLVLPPRNAYYLGRRDNAGGRPIRPGYAMDQ
jgi:hypothetical protein